MSERLEAAEVIADVVEDYFGNGACDIRLVVEGLGREEWDELQLPEHRRGTDGSSVKVDKLAIGCSVEFVRQPDEARRPELIPIGGRSA